MVERMPAARLRVHRHPALRWLPAIPLGLFLLTFCTLSRAEVQTDLEYQLKAALIYKLSKFVNWPEHALREETDSMVICIYGEDPFGKALDKVAERRIHGRPITVRRAIEATEAPACHIIYLNPDSRRDSLQLLENLKLHPILTISDSPFFANNGGMIEITRKDRTLAFSINAGVARRAGLKLASPLLELATIVGDEL